MITANKSININSNQTENMAMIQANRLKKVLDNGDKAWGIWQTIPGTNVSRALANSGVDWVLVDCEHGNIAGRHNSLHLYFICKAKQSYL